MREDLRKELTNAVIGHGEVKPVIERILEDYSEKIATVCNPLDSVSAPFVIAILNQYSQIIASAYPEVTSAARDLQINMKYLVCKIPIKGGAS